MGGRPLSANVFHTKSLRAQGGIAVLIAASLVPSGAALLRSSNLQARGNVTRRVAQVQAGPPSGSESLTYLLHTLHTFKQFAEDALDGVHKRHTDEDARLGEAIQNSEDEAVKLALQQSVTSNKASFLETERIYDNMVSFSDSLSGLLEATTGRSGGTCDQLDCGEHASCTDTTEGAECVCNEGYVGQGRNCHAPPEFLPHRLIHEGAGGLGVRATDLHVCVFERNKIAVAFRDTANGNAGQLVVGSVREAGLADLSPPEQFTSADGRAFNPVVAGTAGRRLAVVWRDGDRTGSCWMRGAVVGAAGIRGADLAITWGEKTNFCQDQSHRMAMIAVPGDRIAVLFSDKDRPAQGPVESFGNSLLAQIGDGGAISVLGQFRFTDYAVCRLEVTKLTPTAFVLAARAANAVDDLDPSVTTKQEAMAMYGEVIDNDLVFDPNPVNLEPRREQIWARGVSLIAPNTFAYAYQDGMDLQMKMAVIEVDPTTHRMRVAREPAMIRKGFSPYVSMLSVPYTPSEPHTLVAYENQATNTSMVSICSWNANGKTLDRCEDFSWLSLRTTSLSGVHLGGGRSFFVFSTEAGVPYYSVFGLSKK